MRFFASTLLLALAGACGSPAPAKKIEWLLAPEGAVAPLVAAEMARAKQRERMLLVYVGATWCEPCKRFHDAVQAGKLDARFGALRLIAFDLDRDGERLRAAGYDPKLIPLLALPRDDGHASGKQLEGSVKGDGAIDEIVPRLAALLGQ